MGRDYLTPWLINHVVSSATSTRLTNTVNPVFIIQLSVCLFGKPLTSSMKFPLHIKTEKTLSAAISRQVKRSSVVEKSPLIDKPKVTATLYSSRSTSNEFFLIKLS